MSQTISPMSSIWFGAGAVVVLAAVMLAIWLTRQPQRVDHDEWWFDYEQTPLSGAWVYKFDHEPIADGHWHQLNKDARAMYRIVQDDDSLGQEEPPSSRKVRVPVDGKSLSPDNSGRYLQFVAPAPQVSKSELETILEAFSTAGPLDTEDELEVVIRRRNEHYEMWSVWVDGDEGITFDTLEQADLREAYRRLRELEEQS